MAFKTLAQVSDFTSGVRVHVPKAPSPLIDYFVRQAIRDFCDQSLLWQAPCAYNDLEVNKRDYGLVVPNEAAVVRLVTAKIKLTKSSGDITGATQTDPIEITAVEHGLTSPAKVFITGVVGMTEINNKIHSVGELLDEDHFTIKVDGTGYNPYFSGGTWNNESAYQLIRQSSDFALDTTMPGWRINNGTSFTRYTRDYAPARYRVYLEDTTTANINFDPAEDVPNGLQVWCAFKPVPNSNYVPGVLFDNWREPIEAGATGLLMRMPNKAWSNPKGAADYTGIYLLGRQKAIGDRMAGNVHRPRGVAGSIAGYT